MNSFFKKILSISLLAMAGVSVAVALDLPTTMVNGNRYYYYTVKKGETLYSIGRSLGISREDIVKHNPAAADVLHANSRLLFPVAEFGSDMTYVNHTVKRGETLFGISRQYGVSVDKIVQANPSADEGLKAGATLRIPISVEAAADLLPKSEAAEQQKEDAVLEPLRVVHVARQGETLDDISREYGISVEHLEELNPLVAANGINAGDYIRLTSTAPIKKNDEPSIPTPVNPGKVAVPVVVVVDDVEPVEDEQAVSDSIVEPEPITETQVIALMLPFMLNEEKPSKPAQLVTDFYRGFLLGAEDLADKPGAPVKVITFDTRNDAARVKQLLSRNDIKSADVIVGPDDEAQLAEIARFAADEGIFVFNILSVKDSSQIVNPYVMQANITTSDMNARAARAVIDRFPGYIPVILRNTAGRNDKEAFVEVLKSTYLNAGLLAPMEVEFSGTLTPGQLSFAESGAKYVFIPTSGSLSEFNKISGAIKTVRENTLIPDDIALMGYPDWVAFKGESTELLHSLGAVIFSRFYYDPSNGDCVDFLHSYADVFGALPSEVLPIQGQLGYDTAVFLINALRRNGGDFDGYIENNRGVVRGLQSSFRFSGGNEDATDGIKGYANDALYIVKFLPIGREVEVTVVAD